MNDNIVNIYMRFNIEEVMKVVQALNSIEGVEAVAQSDLNKDGYVVIDVTIPNKDS